MIFVFLILIAFIELFFVNYFVVLAKKLKLVDIPDERKMHSHPKPRGAGITFFIVLVIAVLIFKNVLFIDFFPKLLIWLILGGVVVILGFLDDIFDLKPIFKVIVQVIVAFLFVIFVERSTFFIRIPMIQLIISALWIIGIMNSFNLMDNMDGLSGGTALICCLIFGMLNLQLNNAGLAMLFFILAFIMLGFLPHNFYPSSCFMGDSGSLFIGYVISTLSIMGVYTEFSRLRHLPVVIPFLILSVPIYDTLSVIIIRIKNKKSIFQGDKNHFSHRLHYLGLSQRSSVIYIYLVTLITGLSAFLLVKVNWLGALVLLFQTLVLFILLTILIITKRKNNNG